MSSLGNSSLLLVHSQEFSNQCLGSKDMICIELHTSLHQKELTIFCILYQTVALLKFFSSRILGIIAYTGCIYHHDMGLSCDSQLEDT